MLCPNWGFRYTLRVAAPRIRITAATVYGAIYALESLSQLLDAAAGDVTVNATLVVDKPRFAFRATMIDTARHWCNNFDIIFGHLTRISPPRAPYAVPCLAPMRIGC